jgi:hypothetical protein
MEERKKSINSTKQIRITTRNTIRKILRSDLPSLIHLIHNRVLMKVRSPIANAIIDQEVEIVIIVQDQGLMKNEDMTHVIERIGIILVKGEETPEKETLAGGKEILFDI